MEGWRHVRLGDVAELSGGYAFKSTQYTDAGHFVLRTVNIRDDFSITREGATFISEQDALEYTRFSLTDKDTLFVMVAATLGKVGYVRHDALPALLNQNMWVIRAKPRQMDPAFLQFCFRELSKIPLAWVSGSARSFLRRDDVRNLEFDLPPLPEQRAIAAILGALDDKIELNRRKCETLESMARVLFRDWFVDFGPTRAKMAGAAPYLAADLWSLLPDRLDDEGKPEGWEVRPIKANCSFVANGSTPKRDVAEYWTNGEIPWLSSGEVRQRIITKTNAFITERGLAESSAKLIDPGATVVALYGATAGQVSILAARVTTNQAVCALTAKPMFRLYNFLKLSSETETLLGMATGSAQQNLSKGIVENFPVLVADIAVMEAFEAIVSPLFEAMVAQEQETGILAETRDLLLPRLMSGELRVTDAEHLEEVL